jgi:hypothetical protein
VWPTRKKAEESDDPDRIVKWPSTTATPSSISFLRRASSEKGIVRIGEKVAPLRTPGPHAQTNVGVGGLDESVLQRQLRRFCPSPSREFGHNGGPISDLMSSLLQKGQLRVITVVRCVLRCPASPTFSGVIGQSGHAVMIIGLQCHLSERHQRESIHIRTPKSEIILRTSWGSAVTIDFLKASGWRCSGEFQPISAQKKLFLS